MKNYNPTLKQTDTIGSGKILILCREAIRQTWEIIKFFFINFLCHAKFFIQIRQ